MFSNQKKIALWATLGLSTSVALAQQQGERDILPQSQPGSAKKAQAHCPL